VFTDGYQSFTLGTMGYLNCENQFAVLTMVFFIGTVILFALSVYVLRKEKKDFALMLFVIVGLLGVSIAVPVFSYMNQIHYPARGAQSDFTRVGFVEEYSDFEVVLLPSLSFDEHTDRYGTFYVWTQRIGCVPSLEPELMDAVETSDVLVIINPAKSFDDAAVDSLVEYVNSGGRVLVMDSIDNVNSTVNELLTAFDVQITVTTDVQPVINGNVSDENATRSYLSITGGEPIVLPDDNETLVSVVEIVNVEIGCVGKVVVVVDSSLFSDAVLGGTFTEPDERQRRFYNTEFYLFEEILLKD
jgi:hypothetical protein